MAPQAWSTRRSPPAGCSGLPIQAVMPAHRPVPARVRALLQTLRPESHAGDE